MDILTHAGIGLIGAAPFAASRPALAFAFAAGSVLPDLDSLARIFGKHAFLKVHQTWSHALPIQALASLLAGIVAGAVGMDGWCVGAGLWAGLVGHTLLDLINTLGVALWLPFSRKRFCFEWVFFIDAIVFTATVVGAGHVFRELSRTGEVSRWPAIAFFTGLLAYCCFKGLLRHRAGALLPNAVSLIPSALLPWRFFAALIRENRVLLLRFNAITGQRKTLSSQEVLDATYLPILQTIPEFRQMRALSPAYHVISAEPDGAGEQVRCRDLRTRNFGTTFGDLEVFLDANRHVTRTEFHV